MEDPTYGKSSKHPLVLGDLHNKISGEISRLAFTEIEKVIRQQEYEILIWNMYSLRNFLFYLFKNLIKF